MQRIFLLFLFKIVLIQSCFSQRFINSTKSKSKEIFLKYEAKNNLKTIVNETDSSLTFLLRDSSVQNLDFILHYDNQGKCDKEKTALSCDSCYHKILDNVIHDKYCRWTKIDNETYFSRFPYRLILKTNGDKKFCYEIRRSDIEAHEYRQKIKNALIK